MEAVSALLSQGKMWEVIEGFRKVPAAQSEEDPNNGGWADFVGSVGDKERTKEGYAGYIRRIYEDKRKAESVQVDQDEQEAEEEHVEDTVDEIRKVQEEENRGEEKTAVQVAMEALKPREGSQAQPEFLKGNEETQVPAGAKPTEPKAASPTKDATPTAAVTAASASANTVPLTESTAVIPTVPLKAHDKAPEKPEGPTKAFSLEALVKGAVHDGSSKETDSVTNPDFSFDESASFLDLRETRDVYSAAEGDDGNGEFRLIV